MDESASFTEGVLVNHTTAPAPRFDAMDEKPMSWFMVDVL